MLFLAEQPPLPPSLSNGSAAPAAKPPPALIKVPLSSRLASSPCPPEPCRDFVPVWGQLPGMGLRIPPPGWAQQRSPR